MNNTKFHIGFGILLAISFICLGASIQEMVQSYSTDITSEMEQLMELELVAARLEYDCGELRGTLIKSMPTSNLEGGDWFKTFHTECDRVQTKTLMTQITGDDNVE